MKKTLISIIAAVLTLAAAAQTPDGVTFTERRDTLSDGAVCVSFIAVADMKANPKLRFNAVNIDGGTTPSELYTSFAERGRGRAVAIVNAGFFNMLTVESVCLVVSGSEVEAPERASTTRRISEDSTVKTYPIHAAFGLMPDGTFETQWIYSQPEAGGHPYVYPFAVGNDDSLRLYSPVPPAVGQLGSYPWQAVEALGAGPMLVRNGRDVSLSSSCGELYYRTIGGRARHPRTAIGVTGDGKIVLVVADGRGMNGSAGCTLAELAAIMIDMGVTEGINLDGGGSSAMVDSEGRLLNRPSDSGKRPERIERRVPTFAVISEEL